jgi:hypothetical protein
MVFRYEDYPRHDDMDIEEYAIVVKSYLHHITSRTTIFPYYDMV